MKINITLVLILVLFSAPAAAKPHNEAPPTAMECVEILNKYDDSFVRRWLMCDYDKECEGRALDSKKLDPQCAPYVDIK